LKFTLESYWEEDAEAGPSLHDRHTAGCCRAECTWTDDEEGDHGQWSIGSVSVRANGPRRATSRRPPDAVFRSTAIPDLESAIAHHHDGERQVTAVDFGRLT
jgi:hypothetical protein